MEADVEAGVGDAPASSFTRRLRSTVGQGQPAAIQRRITSLFCGMRSGENFGIVGSVVKDPVSDQVVWREYLETVVRERDGWRDFYRAARDA